MWGNSSERSVFPGLKAPSSVPTLGLLGAAERGPFCCPSSFRGQHPLKPLSVQVHRLLGDAACMRTSPHRCGPPRQIDLISNQQLCSLLYFLCYLELVWGLTFFFFFNAGVSRKDASLQFFAFLLVPAAQFPLHALIHKVHSLRLSVGACSPSVPAHLLCFQINLPALSFITGGTPEGAIFRTSTVNV